VFQALNVEGAPIQPVDQLITFTVTLDKSTPPPDMALVLINGQNLPIVEKVQNAVVKDGVATFEAFFPHDEYVLDGLTIAALTNSSGPFDSAEAVANFTIAGPGLIEVN